MTIIEQAIDLTFLLHIYTYIGLLFIVFAINVYNELNRIIKDYYGYEKLEVLEGYIKRTEAYNIPIVEAYIV